MLQNKEIMRILLICFSFFSAVVFANSKNPEFVPARAYIGITSSGIGVGKFGHAFLAVSPSKESFKGANVYNFTLKLFDADNEEQSDFGETLNPSDQPFILEKRDFNNFLQIYREQESRAIAIFPIDFTKAELLDFYKYLESEFYRRRELEPRDYNVLSSNCLTKAIDSINRSVRDPGKEIQTFWHKDGKNWWEVFDSHALLSNVPIFVLSNLKRSKIIASDKVVMIKPKIFHDLEVLIKLDSFIASMGERCGWEPKTTEILQEMLINKNLRYQRSFLKAIQRLVDKCSSAEVSQDYKKFLRVLRFLAKSKKNKLVVNEFIK